jgi:hypothetical protein
MIRMAPRPMPARRRLKLAAPLVLSYGSIIMAALESKKYLSDHCSHLSES